MAAKRRRRLCSVLLAVSLLSLTVASKGFAVTSDDFSDPVLNTGLWWFVDPLGDGDVAINGTQALISVPAGVSHDVWTSGNFAPRLMQAAEDTDFEIEVKFESVPSAQYQLQGLLAEQDSGNFVRADFYSDGSSVQVFAATFSNGAPSVKVNSPINVSGSDLYMRLTRDGNMWTLSYSEDGLNWVPVTSFAHSLAVQSVGVFSGNAGASPAHTAVVDYFFNTAAPIEPEDGEALYSLTVNATGSGSVTKNPDQLQYQPGESVELTAVPSAGWAFTGWTGDAAGSDNPITVTVNSNLIIGTDFALTGPQQHALSVLKSGEGFGTVTSAPAGVDCGVDCSEYYDKGISVALTALPEASSEFAGWTGSGDCSDGVVTMDGPHSCTATFNLLPVPQHTLSISALGAGQVALNPSGGVYDQGTSVQISAIPDDGWLFEGWSGDLVTNQNPATLVMDQDYSVVGNFAPDSIPPVISDIQVAAGQTSATVTWTTDEPATGIVDYGETVAYELGSVQDSVLATDHVVTLTGLDPGVDYHLQVTATDDSLNAAVSPDVFFSTTTDPSGIVSDDFNTSQLNTDLWWFVDPLSDGQVVLDGTRALISVPAGPSHDMWGPGFESPRIMQASEDTNFEIEVKFESVPSSPYQMQGIVAEQDSSNLIRADFYSNGSSVQVFAATFSNGAPSVKVNSSINVSDGDLYLRLTRDGSTWTQSYSEDGLNWVTVTSFNHSLAVQSVGVFAGNFGSQSAPAYTAIVDYFFNTAAPIEPEDGEALYSLTVNATGSGSVTKNPDQLQYQPGESVELTAVPSAGWAFTGWTGDAAGSDNPITVTVNSNLIIGTDFALTGPQQHALSVLKSGEGFGTVTSAPAGVDCGVDCSEYYDKGISVALTALPEASSEFAGWTGSGDCSDGVVTMDGPHSCTATFNLLPVPQHTLSISALGAGQVALNPSGGVYDQGTSVQISAIPDDGWLFEGWSGDLVTNQNPATLVMDQDYSVVGNFAPDSIPPVISDIQVAAGQTSATVTWTTDEPATGIVDYGETVAYELGSVQDSVLATDHVVTLTGLDPGVDYHLQVTATDDSLNAAVSPDVFFSTTTDPSGIVSDDFNASQLNTGLWWFVDPLSDGQVVLDGTRALISVPAGPSHDMWGPGFESPRIMQASEDTNFEIEVKFESVPSSPYQMQGIVAEQDSSNLIRADFYSNGSSVQVFAATFSNGAPSVKVNSSINVSDGDLYLRLTRDGSTWTQSYSEDGLNWVTVTSFNHSLAVQSVGVFAGNFGSQSAPAYTAIVDYFFNTAVPIEPEDGNTLYAVTVGVTGSGSVTKNPDQADYQPGDLVELTAVPSSGWTFTGWSGDATGPDNPLNVVVNANLSITAAFTSPSQVTLDVAIMGSGQVSLDPPGGVYSEGSVVELTAVGDPNWQFAAWSGDLTGTQNPATIVMMGDHAVVGSFSFSPGPVIDVWYGSDQTFGSIGVPQPWVNILGNVSDPEGVSQLTFSLNGGPEQDLSMGPYRRLEEPGDFNIEIAFVELFDGINQVDIYAADGLDNLSTRTVSVNFISGNVWPLDYSIDWSSESRVQDSAQVVDGLWQLTGDRLRPSAYGYDRTVAIGDWSWTDYEVLVPITLHDFSPEGFTGLNWRPAFGIALRWPGHTNWTGYQQPSWGWYPAGATAWYEFHPNESAAFSITDFDRLSVTDPTYQYLLFDVPYLMRMRVETLGEESSRYSLKVWDANEQEPQEWEVVAVDTSDVPSGSLLLIAHYVDVSFGNIVIRPIP